MRTTHRGYKKEKEANCNPAFSKILDRRKTTTKMNAEDKAIITKKGKDAIDIVAAADVAFNFGDWSALKDNCTDDILYEEIGTGRNVNGIENFLDIIKDKWKVAFPDCNCKFSNELRVDHMGDTATVIFELVWSGTHKGSLELEPSVVIPPTGKSMTMEAVQICEVVGTKVRSIRQYLDISSMLKQLGVEMVYEKEKIETKEAPARLETKRSAAQ